VPNQPLGWYVDVTTAFLSGIFHQSKNVLKNQISMGYLHPTWWQLSKGLYDTVTGYSDAEVSKITGLHRNSMDRFISLYKEKDFREY